MVSSMHLNEIMNNPPETILHVHYDYTSKQEDELTLKRGSQLEVISTDERVSGSAGWWTGRLVDSKSVGIFPANFVATSQPELRIIPEKDLAIGDLIGVGGFGHVHYGKFGDVEVAIKTAKSLSAFSTINTPTTHRKLDDDHQTKTLIEGLLREARVFANLKHPNIIHLYGVCSSSANQNVYLVMEYAHGALNQLLQRRKSGLYPSVFIHYAKQIAEGMKYLHHEADVPIIHRDLKCSNILILEPITDITNDQELKEKTLKITDFGLAKRQMTSSSSSAAGTYPWMSPECIRNEEYSVKSDVWSFGVLLWECLTGEVPYEGFNQMQVAFGVATQKYSLPIPSSCPAAFAQLMKKCWLVSPQDRPSFIELCDEINSIIERDYSDHQLVNSQPEEEIYQSLQQDWRAEIKQIFDQLKNIEQEIRDREQLILKHNDELNEQRTALEQREQNLREREMHLIEMQLKLILGNNNNNDSESNHSQAPRLFKRSGRFMRSLIPVARIGCSLISSHASHIVISEPQNFRHLMSIDRDRQFHIPNSQTEPLLTIRSTPSTPSTCRARTLTSSGDQDDPPSPTEEIHAPSTSGSDLDQILDHQKTRSSSECLKKRDKRRRPWRTEKSASSPNPTIKKSPKTSRRLGEAKWYLDSESISSVSTNTIDTISLSSAHSTPTLDLPTKRLGSSTSSVYTNPTEHSLARGLFDITSMLMTIVLGRPLPNPNSLESSSRPKLSTSSSLSFSPPPLPKKQHKRTASSPIETVNEEVTFRARPCYSPVRPNSLVLNPIPPPPSSFHSTSDSISQSDSQLDHHRRTYPSRMSSTPEEAEIDDQHNSTTTNKCHLSKSAQQLHISSLLDIETDEQRRHQTEILPPEIDRKKFSVSLAELERDFLP